MTNEVTRIIREEAWRSVVWFGISLFAWAIIVTESNAVAASVGTVLGLPLLTTVIIAGGLVAFRLLSGRELKATGDGAYLAWIVGVVIGAFAALYYVLVLDGTPLVSVLVLVGALVGFYVVRATVARGSGETTS